MVHPTLSITLGAHFCHKISSHHHIRLGVMVRSVLYLLYWRCSGQGWTGRAAGWLEPCHQPETDQKPSSSSLQEKLILCHIPDIRRKKRQSAGSPPDIWSTEYVSSCELLRQSAGYLTDGIVWVLIPSWLLRENKWINQKQQQATSTHKILPRSHGSFLRLLQLSVSPNFSLWLLHF